MAIRNAVTTSSRALTTPTAETSQGRDSAGPTQFSPSGSRRESVRLSPCFGDPQTSSIRYKARRFSWRSWNISHLNRIGRSSTRNRGFRISGIWIVGGRGSCSRRRGWRSFNLWWRGRWHKVNISWRIRTSIKISRNGRGWWSTTKCRLKKSFSCTERKISNIKRSSKAFKSA